MANDKGKSPRWLTVLVAGIASYAKLNTDVALAFVAEPDAFRGLTEAQRCRVFNTAMILHGLALTMPKVPRGDKQANVWDTDRLAQGLEAVKGRDPVPFSWVQVRFNPLPEPNGNARPSLSAAYESAREAGALGKDAPSFVDACVALSERDRRQSEAEYNALRAKHGLTGDPVLVQRPVKGGYVVAVKADLPEREARAGSKTVKSLTDILGL